jgi:spore germination cell wall hydrolase CwlJ-like protein
MIEKHYISRALAPIMWLALMLTLLLWANPAQPTDLLDPVSELPAKINTTFKPADLQCLAENIYFEAGNQPKLGKVAVGVVTLNRAEDHRFPDSVCGVVRQTSETKNGRVCQFSWWCMNKPTPNQNNKNWRDSLRVAQMLLEGGHEQYRAMFENILFFHASSLKTNWHRYHSRVVQIGDHIFYK